MRGRTTKETFVRLVETLRKEKKVTFTRYGDGDIYVMHGRSPNNHRYCPALADELMEGFNIDDPNYIIAASLNFPTEPGMEGLFAKFPYDNQMQQWCLNNPKLNVTEDSVFENPVMFPYFYVYRRDLIAQFVDEFIIPKKKMVIANCGKEDAERLFGKIDHYVDVPPRFAYESINEWWPQIEETIDDVELCLPFAGSAGKVIQKRLWKMDKEIHCIDMGSVIDAALNKPTRTWIKQISGIQR
jgi:hypothetical protein